MAKRVNSSSTIPISKHVTDGHYQNTQTNTQQVKPAKVNDSSKKQTFDYMFAKAVELLAKATDFATLNHFLKSLCHLRTQLPYISLKLYEHCTTTAEILESLRPQFINPMHLYLLKKIVDKFGCDQAKELVRQYDTNFSRDIPLKRLGDPLTDEEIEACVGMRKLKVVIDRDLNGVTKRDVEVYQGVIARNTGIPPEVIVYAKHTPGSVMFLIPEGTTEAFINPTVEHLLFLSGSGVVGMEVDGDICSVLGRLEMIVELEERPVQVTPRRAFTGSSAGSAMSLESGYGESRYGRRTGSRAMSSGSGFRYGSHLFPSDSSGTSLAVKLAKKLRGTPAMKDLYLSGNRDISEEGIVVLAGFLHVSQTLEKLSVRITSLSERGIATLADGLCNNRNLKELNLSGYNGMSDEGMGVLAGCLRVNQTLEKLDLMIAKLSDRGVAALADGLSNNRGLRELNLSWNRRVSDEGVGVLAGCLPVNQTLERLSLCATSLADKGVGALADGLRNNRGLRQLNLSFNDGISDEGICMFAGCLHVNLTLEKLDLKHTKLSDRGVAALADGLCNNRGLRKLEVGGRADPIVSAVYGWKGAAHLSGNRGISDEGVCVLAGCLHVNKTLEKLRLGDISLSDRGTIALADGLCNNRSLIKLNLSGNYGISDEGIGVLAGCFHVNQTLKKLNLFATSLSDKGMAALADGLCKNRGLTKLNLSANRGISDGGVGVFAGCLHVNQTLEKLNLSGNGLSDRGVAALADGLCHNRGIKKLKLPRNVSVRMRRILEDIAKEKEDLTIQYW